MLGLFDIADGNRRFRRQCAKREFQVTRILAQDASRPPHLFRRHLDLPHRRLRCGFPEFGLMISRQRRMGEVLQRLLKAGLQKLRGPP